MSDLFQPVTMEDLLGVNLYRKIGKQILFFDEESGQYVITDISKDKKFTADDYAKLPERAPYQLIEGKLVFEVSHTCQHQGILGDVLLLIYRYVRENKPSETVLTYIDVHFDKENVYQPDVIYISDKRSSIIKEYIFGAPDFTLEVLSKSTEKIDRNEKMRNYGKFGVDEYWIVNPNKENIEVYHNQLGVMIHIQTAEKGKSITSKAIEGFTLNVGDVFQ